MVSRQNLSAQTVKSRDSLIAALRDEDSKTELIALRARNLLRCKPNGDERDAWLRSVLPQGDTRKVLKALRTVNGGGTPAKASAGNGQPATDTDGANNGGGPRQQQRGRHPKRHRRT